MVVLVVLLVLVRVLSMVVYTRKRIELKVSDIKLKRSGGDVERGRIDGLTSTFELVSDEFIL